MSIGEQAVDYAQVAAKEKLTELQLRIRQLLEQVEQITKEQAYQRVSQPAVMSSICVTIWCHFSHDRYVKSISARSVTALMLVCCGGHWVRVLY